MTPRSTAPRSTCRPKKNPLPSCVRSPIGQLKVPAAAAAVPLILALRRTFRTMMAARALLRGRGRLRRQRALRWRLTLLRPLLLLRCLLLLALRSLLLRRLLLRALLLDLLRLLHLRITLRTPGRLQLLCAWLRLRRRLV